VHVHLRQRLPIRAEMWTHRYASSCTHSPRRTNSRVYWDLCTFRKKNIYVQACPHVRVVSFRSSHRRVTIRCVISGENSKGLRGRRSIKSIRRIDKSTEDAHVCNNREETIISPSNLIVTNQKKRYKVRNYLLYGGWKYTRVYADRERDKTHSRLDRANWTLRFNRIRVL